MYLFSNTDCCSFQVGLIAWLLSTGVGLLLAFLRFEPRSKPFTSHVVVPAN
jgi:hypothetical protein